MFTTNRVCLTSKLCIVCQPYSTIRVIKDSSNHACTLFAVSAGLKLG